MFCNLLQFEAEKEWNAAKCQNASNKFFRKTLPMRQYKNLTTDNLKNMRASSDRLPLFKFFDAYHQFYFYDADCLVWCLNFR